MGIISQPSVGLPRDAVVEALERLNDAEHQYRALEGAWKRYLDEVQPYVETRATELTRRFELIARIPQQPGGEAAKAARYCIADARAALDNLVHGLAEAANASKTVLGDSQFPTESDVDRWEGVSHKRLRGLSPEVIERVKLTQPFAAEKRPPLMHPLKFLARATGDDKHRKVLRLGLVPYFAPHSDGLVSSFTVRNVPNEHAAQVKEHLSNVEENFDLRVTVLEDGEAIWSMSVPDGIGTFEYDVRAIPFSLVAWMEGVYVPGPLLPQLRNALRFTRECILWVGPSGDTVPDPWASVEVGPVGHSVGAADPSAM